MLAIVEASILLSGREKSGRAGRRRSSDRRDASMRPGSQPIDAADEAADSRGRGAASDPDWLPRHRRRTVELVRISRDLAARSGKPTLVTVHDGYRHTPEN